jgi:hypothetical protein
MHQSHGNPAPGKRKGAYGSGWPAANHGDIHVPHSDSFMLSQFLLSAVELMIDFGLLQIALSWRSSGSLFPSAKNQRTSLRWQLPLFCTTVVKYP